MSKHVPRTNWLATVVAAAIPFSAAGAAEDTAALEQRVADLERRLDAAPQGGMPAIEWSGVVEVEALSAEDFAGTEASDIELATVELGVDAAVNESVSAGVVLLHEAGMSGVAVDEAVITIAAPDAAWSTTFGRTYVPFGAYATGLISDPLPLEIGEAQEEVALAGFDGGAFRGSAYVFNGDSNDGGDDEIEHFGLGAGAGGATGAVSWDVGAGYISSIADSDGLAGGVTNPGGLDDYVAGYDVHAAVGVGSLTLIAEYLAAADAFDASELAFNGAGAEPAAWQTEVGYGFELGGMPATVSAGVQGTAEAVALGLPETRALAGLALEPWAATSVALELRSEGDYDTADGGTGNSADTLTLQLAAEF